MESAAATPAARSTGRWYVLGGVLGIILSLVVILPYLTLVSVFVLVFGLLKWTYEASTRRALLTGDADAPSQLASVVFFTEITVLGLFALAFSVVGLVAIGLGDPIDAEAENARNQAALIIPVFLVASIGVLAWAMNRWAFRRRSAYLIPALVPVAAFLTLASVRLVIT